MDPSHEYKSRRKQKLIETKTTDTQTDELDLGNSVEQKNCSTQTSSTHVVCE